MTRPEEQSIDETQFDFSPDEFRRHGRRVIESMAEVLEAEGASPVLLPASGQEIRDHFAAPLPLEGVPFEKIADEWQDGVVKFSRRNGHPRFFAYVCPSADPVGMFADAMTSALNQTVTSWRSAPAATAIERLVMQWLDDLVGFGGRGTGIMVSGGSAANLHGLACAVSRTEHATPLPPGSRHRMTLYVSRDGHVSMRKAAHLLGFVPEHVRTVPIDAERRLKTLELRRMLEDDRASGLVPAAVGATAGTANTGAIDPLLDIADLCREHEVWLHIDGSYGAPAALTDEYRWMREAFSRADSLSLDPHKWMFAPLDAGSILVRDEAVARAAFTLFSEYTAVSQTDEIERFAFFDNGMEMSRRFRALKVWTILKARGSSGLRNAIQRNVDLRKHLERRASKHPRLNALGGDLSIACFRYVPASAVDPETLNEINREILQRLLAGGECYLSPTTLEGSYSLRVCIINFRTKPSDIDFLLDEVVRLGDEIVSEGD